MRIGGKLSLYCLCATMVGTAYAMDSDPRSITTSQKYVEEGLSNRQDTIPTKSGTVAIAPTSTKGTLAERQVKTTLGDETTNQSDTGITTVATVNAASDNKQAKLLARPAGNIVTYTGTQDDQNASEGKRGKGVVTTTPIYDSTKNTYAGGLVRAETLNAAVATAVSSALTPVAAGFQINDISNVLPTTIYVTATDTPDNYCFKNIDPSYQEDRKGGCSTTMFNSMTKGDWGLTYSKNTGISYPGDTCDGEKCYKEIRGISSCSDKIGGGAAAIMDPESIYANLETAHETSLDGSTPPGRFCHCRLVEPHIGVGTSTSPWVFMKDYSSATYCATHCAIACIQNVTSRANFRGAILGAVNQN